MHTLVLNGSPHVDGDSMTVTRELLTSIGGDHEILHIYMLNFRPCMGCGKCAENDTCSCIIRDAMADVWRGLKKADCIVLSSPLHFTSLSGPLVTLIGRFQPAWRRFAEKKERVLSEKPRSGVLVVTGGGSYKNMFTPARSVAAAAFATLGVPFAGMIGVSGLDMGKGRDGVAVWRDEVRTLAEKVLSTVHVR